MVFGLKELKEQYKEYVKKYDLPSFEKVNGVFEIEKIDKESDCLLKVVRKAMMEKIVNTLGFLDMFSNPVNLPRVYYSFMKSITQEDKKMMDEIYFAFGELSTESLELEVDYTEKKEADMIKKVYGVWNLKKEDIARIFANVRNPKANNEKKEKGYFG